jgi:hypothetical protein
MVKKRIEERRGRRGRRGGGRWCWKWCCRLRRLRLRSGRLLWKGCQFLGPHDLHLRVRHGRIEGSPFRLIERLYGLG